MESVEKVRRLSHPVPQQSLLFAYAALICGKRGKDHSLSHPSHSILTTTTENGPLRGVIIYFFADAAIGKTPALQIHTETLLLCALFVA